VDLRPDFDLEPSIMSPSFQDMANRETIMDLMMDYTRKRDYQFCFLTPLNTSNIKADKDVSIHRYSSLKLFTRLSTDDSCRLKGGGGIR